MPEPTALQQDLIAEAQQKLREQFTMLPMSARTEVDVRAEAERLGRDAFGDQFGGIGMTHLYRCPTRDCDFESLDPEATCSLHGRRVYDCGYAIAVNVVPEEIEITVVKDVDD